MVLVLEWWKFNGKTLESVRGAVLLLLYLTKMIRHVDLSDKLSCRSEHEIYKFLQHLLKYCGRIFDWSLPLILQFYVSVCEYCPVFSIEMYDSHIAESKGLSTLV